MGLIEKLCYHDYSVAVPYFSPVFDTLGAGLALLSGINRNVGFPKAVTHTMFLASFPDIINYVNGHLESGRFLVEAGCNLGEITLMYAVGCLLSSGSKKNKGYSENITKFNSPFRCNDPNKPKWWSKR